MKSSKVVGVWRPVMGVAIVGSMALAISVMAGPRGTDQTVRTEKGGKEVTRLVTGNPAQINAVTAAYPPNTLVLAVTPVNPPPGIAAYPAGVSINGQELTIDRNTKEGFRAWFHVQLSNWDPTHTGAGDPAAPAMAAYQVKINCSGYYASDCFDVDNTPGDGLDLKPAILPCTPGNPGNTFCRSAAGYGEAWVKCVPGGVGTICPGEAGCCENGYLDSAAAPATDPTPEGKGWCKDDGCAGFGVAVGTCNYNYFGVSDNAAGKTDAGGLYYGGTLVLDLPAGAKGKYTVNLNNDETFAASPGTPPIDIPTVAENGFVVNYVTGACCYLLGTPLAGCKDGSLAGEVCPNRSDCAALGSPFVFTAGGSCANPPSDDGCVECVIQGADPLCDDGDACTTESCNAAIGVCVRGNIPGFNPVKGGPGDTGNCCDKATGALTDKDDGDACTVDSCSAAENRGSAVHDAAAALGATCDDGNSCAVNDRCDGVNSEENGGCLGTGVNGLPCLSDLDCQFGGQAPTATCSADNTCFCTVTPKVTFVLNELFPGKTCIGGFTPGVACAKDTDCPGGGVCDLFPANCYTEGEKVAAVVHIGSAAEPVNGGQFLINYDPSCVSYVGAACFGPYVFTVYGPIVDEGAGTIFIACGVDPFGKIDGPLGNTDIVALSFTMIGQCNNCALSFGGDIDPGEPGSTNPMNTYLVDDGGYKMPVETQPKEIAEFGDLVLNVPDNILVNSDCDMPAANVTWDAPSASFSCGDANLVCRGAHESGLGISGAIVMSGGLLPQGKSSFCCYAWAKHKCDQSAGCAGDTNLCAGSAGKPDGCWTVEISDQTSMDIHVQLEPPLSDDEIERCIEFCLYGNCAEAPYCFQENVLFGGLYNYIGKANGKIKVPKGKWGCITAQDQLHSLRSCDIPDCIDGQLVARFKGDPTYGGNWLIMGNLDAWKKANPDEDPSLDVIDILDFGKFIASWGVCYEDRKYGCHEGPHADINGDGCVDQADYNFILRNFLVSSKDCCCGPAAADLPPALAEVTIEELRQMGEGDLAVADLNGDGVLNAEDMEAFTQGSRPAKANIRKSGKGLRSGR